MDNRYDLMFHLIRYALGFENFQGPVNLSKRGWKNLLLCSARHQVGAIVFQGLSNLDTNMPGKTKAEWESYRDYMNARFYTQLMATNHFASILSDNGISVMILKGLGLAITYPEPQLRECNDIDIYCYDDAEKVNRIATERGHLTGDGHHHEKHLDFEFDGIQIENHLFFTEQTNGALRIMEKEIQSAASSEPMTDERFPGLLFPSPQMGALNLIVHSLSHLAWSGLAVRQLCDIKLYFKHYGTQIDMQELMESLSKSGMDKAAAALMKTCDILIEGKSLPMDDGVKAIINNLQHPIRQSSEFRNPLVKIAAKIQAYRQHRLLHTLVYNEPFPDSFHKSFAFLRKD